MDKHYLGAEYLQLDNEAVRVWKKDGIVIAEFKPNLTIDLETAKLAVRSRKQVGNGEDYPVLVDIRNVKRIEEDARKYLASAEATEYVKAGAIIKDGFMLNLLANWFLKIDKPKVPSRLYNGSQIKMAMRWLELFKTVEQN
ncbi:MAG: hypothetical protein JKY52_00485 [Flavobacteriales bacterium]|nr:hypothetical protein [Flavobacteriales bacterium]